MGIWNKFFECDCHTGGIMLGYERKEDGLPLIDLAFFAHGSFGKQLSFMDRIRFCWKILKTGVPFNDEVILSQKTAKELGKDLLKFANKKYKL